MNTLLKEVLQWLQNNAYRRASFDRIVGIVPSAATYEQLETLVNDNPHIFRHAVMKGGLPGLALQDYANLAELLAEAGAEEVEAPLLVPQAPPAPSQYDVAVTTTASPDAPTVTMDAIEKEIRSEYFRNLGSALKAGNGSSTYNTTLCVLELQNGFVIVGKSACVDSRNFNEETGRRLAREDAVKQVWPFLGFRLADGRASA